MTKMDAKLLIMCILAMVSFGLGGVGAVLLMALLSSLAVAADSANKHGISSSESSRLGGLAIVIMVMLYVVGLSFFSPYTPGVIRSQLNYYMWMTIVFCTLLGLLEDFRPDFLTPLFRLLAKFFGFGLFFWYWPEIIPVQMGLPLIDFMLSNELAAWSIVTIFCIGFINAFNMADGANGLAPGIAAASFALFFIHYGRPIEGILLFALSMFLIFNLISGLFFLGDTGSYGLGAIIALYGVKGVADGDFSPWLMASLLAYPCIDLIFSILRRLKAGASPFSPDNHHLHNLLHGYFKTRIRSKVIANSLTGLTISTATSGLVLLVYIGEWLPPTSHHWLYLFLTFSAGYGLLYWTLLRSADSRRELGQYA